MPNGTVRARARTMSKAKPTKNPDAEIFAIARRVNAKAADLKEAWAALEAREERALVPRPATLLVQEGDNALFSRLSAAVGEPFRGQDCKIACNSDPLRGGFRVQ
jgi:hypothetical protein